jgi:NAD(P)-dependent dehydrogenase (short-subunit alcohol dehydrogenase family)
MSLMIIARPGTHVRHLAEALEQEHGVRCFPAAADVEDPEAVDRLIMHAEQHIGAIDVLIGTVPGCMAAALRPTMEQRGRGNVIDLTHSKEATATEVVAMVTGQ